MRNNLFVHRAAVLLVALLLTASVGCSYYYNRYFERADLNEVRIDRFRLMPRIFAFQDKKGVYEQLKDYDFVVSVRVEDATSQTTGVSWQAEQATIDSLTDAFLDSVAAVFVVDSLVFHQTPDDNERILLSPDRDNFAPRREDYFTLRFGNVNIPLETVRMRVVLHVTRPGSSESETAPDSAVWAMERVESELRGLMAFRDNARGYE